MRFVIIMFLGLLTNHAVAVSPRNWAANLGDIVKYIVTSERALEEYEISPNKFDMSDTNRIYTAEFAPIRARPHHIKLVWQKDDVSKQDCRDVVHWPDLMDGAVFKITITNLENDKSKINVVARSLKTNVIYDDYSLNPKLYESTIYSFNVSDFSWHYRKRIKVDVQMLHAPCCGTYHIGNPRIVVREWYPLY